MVLIKVRACAINNTELWMREGASGTGEKSGWRPEGVQFPRIPGSDITGKVVELGDGVDQGMMGRHVVLFPFTSSGPERKEHLSDDMSFIGSEYDGGYAEYVAWPADLCFDMPLDDFVESAVFSVSGLTAWHMNEQLLIRSGETLTEDRSMPCLTSSGDALFDVSLQVLKKGGKFCISGSAGGQTPYLDFRTLYLKHIAMYRSVLGTRHEFAEMLRSIAEGKLKPVIDRTFPLEEAREA